MDGHTAMPTDAQILTLTQWFSPGYPVGAYAYSHGLEWGIEAGDVRDFSTAKQWVADVLSHGTGWNDALFMSAAFEADGDALAELDEECRAFAPSRERLKEADLQGAAFCEITGELLGARLKGLSYPVAVGRAARLADLPVQLTMQMYLQAFLANLAAVAMRLVPLGQTDGQRLIRDLTPMCSEIAKKAMGATLDDLSSTAFLADIASMKHELQYSRIFRT
ncbi:urease accessory protein UreF [Actibacterium pelagium]